MSDEEQNQSSSSDDSRFEVKWQKKGSTSTPADSGAEAPSGPADSTDDVAALRKQLEEEQARVKDLQDRWHRAQADLANLRRRTEQEKGEVEKFATLVLVSELLPVLDNFERALATVPNNLQMLTWIQGVFFIERHMRALLERQGLEPIEAQGQTFSPHYHEAVSERETSEATPGAVLQEYQKGYTMHGRVIRPTLVEIAKEPAAPDETQEGTAAVDQEAPSGEEIADAAMSENVGP